MDTSVPVEDAHDVSFASDSWYIDYAAKKLRVILVLPPHNSGYMWLVKS